LALSATELHGPDDICCESPPVVFAYTLLTPTEIV
jgi:hypothetical protein